MNTFRLPGFTLELSSLWSLSSKLPSLLSTSILEKAQAGLSKKFGNQTIGFYSLPETISPKELTEIKNLAKTLRSQFEGVLVCGIGGSHLGAASLIEALRTQSDEEAFPIFWLNNVDRWAMEKAKHFVTRKKVATLLISKSGNTTETLSGFFHLSPYLDSKGIVIITDPDSGELRRWVESHGFKSLPVPPNVGGRFSVLTPVGLLPLALGHLDIEKLMFGAKKLKDSLANLAPNENPAYLYALSTYGWDQEGHSLQYLMPYHSQLKLLTDWYVQLWAESLGKKNTQGSSVGPTFVGALGTRDQHSLLQLFKEGPNNKVIGFMDVAPSPSQLKVGQSPVPSPKFEYLSKHTFEEINSKALLATQKSLHTSKVPTYSIVLDSLTEENLGSFILFQELACAIAGELYEINAFDQPGVEEAKKLLRESL